MSGRVDQRFGIVPLWLLKSGASDRAIAFYAWLAAEFVDGSDARADESIEWFAEQSGRSEPSVKRAFAELEKLGAVTRIRRMGMPSLTRIHRSDPISQLDQKRSDDQTIFDPAIPPVKTELKDKGSSSTNRSDPTPSEPGSSPNAESHPDLSSAREVFEHWRSVMASPRSKFTDDKKTKIQARLKQGFTVDDLKRAIDGCAASDFHMGRDPQNDINHGGRLHNGIGLICRNGEKVEEFMARAPEVQPGRTVEEILRERSVLHPEVEVPEYRAERKFPFDAESDRILEAAGIEA